MTFLSNFHFASYQKISFPTLIRSIKTFIDLKSEFPLMTTTIAVNEHIKVRTDNTTGNYVTAPRIKTIEETIKKVESLKKKAVHAMVASAYAEHKNFYVLLK